MCICFLNLDQSMFLVFAFLLSTKLYEMTICVVCMLFYLNLKPFKTIIKYTTSG